MFGRIPTQGRLVPHRQAQPIARSHASLRDLDFWQLQASKHQAEAIRLKKRLAELESENNILVSRSICLKDIECENVQLVNKAKVHHLCIAVKHGDIGLCLDKGAGVWRTSEKASILPGCYPKG